MIVPEVKDGEATGITLLHVRFADRLPAATARGVLQGYRNRYAVLRDAVLETEPTFREDLLAEHPGRRAAHRADQPARRPLAGGMTHVFDGFRARPGRHGVHRRR